MRTLVFTIALASAAFLRLDAQGPALWRPSYQDAAGGQDRRGNERAREEQTDRTTRTVRIGANGELDVGNIAGDITVSRAGGADATIEIVKTARADSAAAARQMLALVEVDVVERAGRADVRTRYVDGGDRRGGGRRNINVRVAFTITVPVGARVTARSVSGNVSARDIKGELVLESVSGNIIIAGAGLVSSAKTVSGDVEIADTDVEGPLNASSVSGSVSVRKIKARSLVLGSISGNVVAEEVECSRAEIQTVNGDLQWTGTLSQGGRYELTSHSGDIQVDLSGDRGFELDATSFSGSIRSEFPLSGQSGVRDRQRPQRTLRGVSGNGSAVLDLTTFSGDIVISRR